MGGIEKVELEKNLNLTRMCILKNYLMALGHETNDYTLAIRAQKGFLFILTRFLNACVRGSFWQLKPPSCNNVEVY